ncbi:hypothetical protein EMIT0357P_30032 [Pseudomonas marginalis]
MRASGPPALKLSSLSQVPAPSARSGWRPMAWSSRVRLPAGTVRSFSTTRSAAVSATKAGTSCASTTTGWRVWSSTTAVGFSAEMTGVATGSGWRLNTSPQYPAINAPISSTAARAMLMRLFMTALPFPLHYLFVNPNELIRNLAVMNI